MRRRQTQLAGVMGAALLAVTVAACGSSSGTGSNSSTGTTSATGTSSGSSAAATSGTPVKVGMVYSKTGLLSIYGAEFKQGFDAGLAYVTKGTGAVDGHPIDVSWADDASTVATGVSAAKNFIGQGYKIIAGTQDSGVADALASLAAQNQVLYIVGDAADDSLTGVNHYTFRAGRQTAQDVLTAKSYLSGSSGPMTVFAQDYAFGTSYLTDAQKLLSGITVNKVLVPLTATDFTPYALKAKAQNPKVLFVAWAGTTGTAMWKSLNDEGLLGSTKVVTGLANRATYDIGSATTKVNYLSLYFYQCCHNAANDYLVNYVKQHDNAVPDLFDADGFVTAQMIARAVSNGGGSDVSKMISSLEGWTFQAPKGTQTIRASDHAMLQPMFQAKLVQQGSGYEPQLVDTLSAQQTAPPPASGS